jgi:hypothetical protein
VAAWVRREREKVRKRWWEAEPAGAFVGGNVVVGSGCGSADCGGRRRSKDDVNEAVRARRSISSVNADSDPAGGMRSRSDHGVLLPSASAGKNDISHNHTTTPRDACSVNCHHSSVISKCIIIFIIHDYTCDGRRNLGLGVHDFCKPNSDSIRKMSVVLRTLFSALLT